MFASVCFLLMIHVVRLRLVLLDPPRQISKWVLLKTLYKGSSEQKQGLLQFDTSSARRNVQLFYNNDYT